MLHLMALATLLAHTLAMADQDAASLVQTAVTAKPKPPPGISVLEEGLLAPVAKTSLGALQGVYEDGVAVFKDVQYGEKPQPFHTANMAKPWFGVKMAQSFGPTCIGSNVGRREMESEDCLRLNIWVPRGGKWGMPVVMFIHDGQNQHGSGNDPSRQGNRFVQSKLHPVIFVSINYRLGIHGWMQGYNVTPNLGLHDQILALRWIHENIAAFGGDRRRVTLESEGDGAHNVIAHMVSPYSKDLFVRAVLISPPANLWARKTNKLRTNFIVHKTGCQFTFNVPFCLAHLRPEEIQGKEWEGAGLFNKDFAGASWWKEYDELRAFERANRISEDTPSFFGWHPVVDGVIIPKEPRVLIRKGKWNHIPTLITLTKNESVGLIHDQEDLTLMQKTVAPLFPDKDYQKVAEEYYNTLYKSGIHGTDQLNLFHQIVTDKLWTCDARSLANDIVVGKGLAFLGIFWHSPSYDPTGEQTNKNCVRGATCHGADMLFALPQSPEHGGFPAKKEYHNEGLVADAYSELLLTWIYSQEHPFADYEPYTEVITHVGAKGVRYAPHYRKAQCDILDAYVGEELPLFVKMRATKAAQKNMLTMQRALKE